MTKQIPLIECWDFVGTTPEKFDGEKRYISTGALDCDHVNEADVEMVTFENRPSRANLAVATGDILFAKMASTEKTFVVDEVASEDIYSTGFCAVRADVTKILPKCLYYFLASSLFLDQKDRNSSGATQKAITNAGLAKIIINLPTLDEQRTFVAQMDLLCEAITARREQLAKLDELVKSRFIELFGDPLINEKGWTVSKLGEYMTLLTDFSSNGSYELLDSNVVMYDEPNYAIMVRTTDLESGNLSDGVKYIDRNAYELLAKSKIYGGELIMNKIGSAGKIYVMPKIDRPASLGRNAFMFRFDERLNMTYLYSLLTSDYGTAEIQQYVRGAVTKTITKESTRSIRIIVPPIALQEQFAAFVEQTDKSKLAIQKSLDKLELLKKSLMQKHFG